MTIYDSIYFDEMLFKNAELSIIKPNRKYARSETSLNNLYFYLKNKYL